MNSFWKGKRVLVTGASGFIGSNAVDQLVKLGASVSAAVSPNNDAGKIKKNLSASFDKITLKKGDILNFNYCQQITAQQDIVLNFAALDGGYNFKILHSAEILKINSNIILNMLEASRQNSVKRFLVMSSIDVYSSKCVSPINESCPLIDENERFVNGYRWSKRFSEITAKAYFQKYKMKIAIARCGNVYGPRDNSKKHRLIPTFITSSLKKKNIHTWSDSSQKKAFLYVTDLLNAVFDLVEKYPTCDPVNIASNNTISYKGLAELIVDLIGNKNKVIEKNYQPGNLANKIIDISKAKEIISFNEKIPLREGLKKTINYLKSLDK